MSFYISRNLGTYLIKNNKNFRGKPRSLCKAIKSAQYFTSQHKTDTKQSKLQEKYNQLHNYWHTSRKAAQWLVEKLFKILFNLLDAMGSITDSSSGSWVQCWAQVTVQDFTCSLMVFSGVSCFAHLSKHMQEGGLAMQKCRMTFKCECVRRLLCIGLGHRGVQGESSWPVSSVTGISSGSAVMLNIYEWMNGVFSEKVSNTVRP